MKRFVFPAVLLCLLAPAVNLFSFPAQADRHINDFAGIMKPEDAAMLGERLKTFEKESGIHIAVLSVDTVLDYGFDSVEEFAAALAPVWRIGEKNRDGVFFVVSVEDRAFVFNLGAAHGVRYDGEISRIIREDILPRFREEDYSSGITDGVLSFSSVVNGKKKKIPVADIALWTAVSAGGGAVILGFVIFGRRSPGAKKEKPDLSFGGGSFGNWK